MSFCSRALAPRGRRPSGAWACVVPMTVNRWRDAELPDPADQGCRTGTNRIGPALVGWDLALPEVINRLEHA
jgi:hypothetical protein